jgi:hypothetical protein
VVAKLESSLTVLLPSLARMVVPVPVRTANQPGMVESFAQVDGVHGIVDVVSVSKFWVQGTPIELNASGPKAEAGSGGGRARRQTTAHRPDERKQPPSHPETELPMPRFPR